MIKNSLLPADTFIIFNKTVLTDNDRKLLIMLYQPIIGALPISLYFTLWSYLDKLEEKSTEWTHHHLMTSMRIRLDDILSARTKLEAIGLLKTYVKKGNINSFIYELYSPLSASEFINNPILGVTLYNNVGTSEYEKIVNYFKVPRIITKDYEEITSHFSDVFEPTNISNFDNLVGDIKKKRTNKLEFSTNIDLNNVISMIPEEILNYKGITKDTKELIYKIAFIYNFDEERMSELIRNSINMKKNIDKTLLRENARRFYQFENSGRLPSLIYRNQPEYLRKPTGDNSKKAKIIYQFETTSPYDFICSKYNGIKPSKSEIDLLEYLLLDMDLKPGVVNVLIDYVLKINNNKLTKKFVETIAAQWAKSKVETVEAAMNLAEREYKSRNNYINKKQNKKLEQTPSWFDKNISENKASEEEINEIKDMLKEFK